MPLFTFLLEFDGGTYISQVRSASVKRAIPKYAGLLVNNVAVPLSVRRRLASGLAEDEPIAIEGIRNVWCCFATVGKKSALLNIISTEYHLDD